MAIDTQAKRMCVDQVVPLDGLPLPDSSVSQFDRSHVSNIYCGIAVQIIASGDWCPDRDSSPGWSNDSDSSDAWVKVQDQERV